MKGLNRQDAKDAEESAENVLLFFPGVLGVLAVQLALHPT
jgi:hypothetical protein